VQDHHCYGIIVSSSTGGTIMNNENSHYKVKVDVLGEAIKMRGPAEPTGQQAIIRGLDMMDEHGDIRDESGPFKQMTRNTRYRGLKFRDRGTGPSGYGMLDVAGDIGMLKDWFVNWYAGGDPYAAGDFDEFVEMV
jgi:hypothetical protein